MDAIEGQNLGVDEATGIVWQLREMPPMWHGDKRGWGNGYVAVKSNHPWFGTENYYSIPTSGETQEITFGKICELHGEEFYVVGFDTAHSWNNPTEHDRNWVFQETMKLLQDAKNAILRLE